MPDDEWKYLFEGKSGVVLLDEGRAIKNMETSYFDAVYGLKGQFYIVCTATPDLNKASDLVAYLKLFQPPGASANLPSHRDESFLDQILALPDDAATLICPEMVTPFFDKYGNMPVEQARKLLPKILGRIELRRTYDSIVGGHNGSEMIGNQVPRTARFTIETRPRPQEVKDYAEVHGTYAEYLKPKDGSNIINGGALRRVQHAAFLPALKILASTAVGDGSLLDQKLEAYLASEESSGDHGLEFLLCAMWDFTRIPFDAISREPEALMLLIAGQSIRIRQLAGQLLYHQERQREKQVIMFEKPITQLLAEIFMLLAGYKIVLIRRKMDRASRAIEIAKFNDQTSHLPREQHLQRSYDILTTTVELFG